MGQVEIFNFLKQKRKKNNDFFSVADIIKALSTPDDSLNGNVARQIRQLYAYGYLEIENVCKLPWRYRLKEKCLIQVKPDKLIFGK